MDGAHRHLPADLGRVEEIDSFAVEAGVIVLDRFCALSKVHRTDHGWWVPVTDVRREFGAAPHHRMQLQLVRAGEEADRKLRKSIHKQVGVHPRTHAILTTREGMLVLTEPCNTPQVELPLTRDEALVVASALAAALDQLHTANVTGVAFAPESLHLVGREVAVVGFEHLLARGTAEEDLQRVVALMELLSGGAIVDLLDPRPLSAAELWDRVHRAQRAHEQAARRITLPGVPPFIGRSEILVRLMEAARRTKSGHSSVMLVRGEVGVGKSRLLDRFSVEVERWMDAVVLNGSYKTGAPPLHGGFVEAVNALAEAPGHLHAAELNDIRARIVERTGTLVGVVAKLTPSLTQFLGGDEAPSQDNLDEKFNRHAATFATAIRAIGTPQRPVIILLDDLHRADRAAFAILRELVHGSRDHNTLVVATTSEPIDADCVDTALDVLPLNRAELRLLIEGSLSTPLQNLDEAAEALWRASQGHLVDAWATMQAWANRSRFSPHGDSLVLDVQELGAAGSVVDLYGEQWAQLSPHQQWVLLVAALRSGRASTAWLSRVTGWNQAEVDNALQPAVATGLLVTEPDGFVRFPNNAVRALIQEAVTEDVKLGAHRQIATWLESEPGASAAQLAWHQEHGRASGRDERLAQRHVRGGQELLNLYDLERAGWHFDMALARAESGQIKVAALEGRGDVALLDGRTDAALDSYLQAMDAGTDPLYALRISAKAMHGFYRKSAPEAAYALAADTLRRVGEPLPTSVVGWAWALLVGFVGMVVGRSRYSTAIRDQLCRVYMSLIATVATERPQVLLLSLARGVRHARGLDTADGAAIQALHGVIRGSMGHTTKAMTLLDEAGTVAARAGHPWGQGVVSHFRAQYLYSIGKYGEAENAILEAVKSFRQAGDLSVAVLSLIYRGLYGRDVHHLSQTLTWIAEAEAIARRQGNELGLLGATTLRAYLRARRGEEVGAELMELSNAILGREVGNESINAHSYLALAFVESGDLVRAERHADEARARIDAMPSAVDLFMDAYTAVAAVHVRNARPGRRPPAVLRRALRTLKASARTSTRLLAPYLYHSAELQRALGQGDKAAGLFARVIDQAGIHHQTFYVHRAHLALAEIYKMSDTGAAAKHRAEAQAQAIELGLSDAPIVAPPAAAPSPAPRPVASLPQVRPVPATRSADVEVASLIRRLRPAFERALPARVPLTIEVADETRASCNAEPLQLLIVNMVLAARDALADDGEIKLSVGTVRLDQEDAARMPGINADAHLRIEVRAIGFNGSETISGLGMCCEITAGIGGFVDVRQELGNVLVIGAYLAPPSTNLATAETPTTPAPRGQAVVYHSSSRTRQTVVSALRDVGVLAEGIDVGLHVLGEALAGDRIVFAEQDQVAELRRANPSLCVVVVQDRSQPVQPGGPTLRVPFTLGEFEQLIDSLIGGDSTDTVRPTR